MMTIRHRPRTALGRFFAVLGFLVGTLTGCADAPAPTPVTHEAAVLADVSGSMREYLSGYLARLEPWLAGLPDGTIVEVYVIGSFSESSTCRPLSTTIQGEGNTKPAMDDDEASDRAAVTEMIQAQLACAASMPPQASDLLGSLQQLGSHPRDRAVKTLEIQMLSDGMLNSAEVRMDKNFLHLSRDDVDKKVARLADADLIPEDMPSDTTLCMSDTGVGANLTTTQVSKVTGFWKSFVDAAGWDFRNGLC